mgnify:CR=1 FL=1
MGWYIIFYKEKLQSLILIRSQLGDTDMSVEKIIEILSQAIESNDWDMIKELLETLRYEGENNDDFSEYLDLDE